MKFIIIALILQSALGSFLLKQLLVNYPEAKCLDGTHPVYYFSKGSGDNLDKFIIFFKGGGWCGSDNYDNTVEACYQRSKTDLGSSKNYPQFIDEQNNILSDDTGNSYFRTWNRVQVKYCDGGAHSGYKEDSISHKGSEIWFRGSVNTISTFNDLNDKYGLKNASQAIITGTSAGGLATFNWANYLSQYMTSGQALAIPDSGMFLNFQNYVTKQYPLKEALQVFGNITYTDKQPYYDTCFTTFPKEEAWKCMLVEYSIQFIKVPLLYVQSEYDAWNVANVLDISCNKNYNLSPCNQDQMAFLNSFRTELVKIMETSLQNNPEWGIFSVACLKHGFLESNWHDSKFVQPSGSNYSVSQAAEDWVKLRIQGSVDTIIHYDTQPWPSNLGCSGTSVFLEKQ